jgi:hypothetical protein
MASPRLAGVGLVAIVIFAAAVGAARATPTQNINLDGNRNQGDPPGRRFDAGFSYRAQPISSTLLSRAMLRDGMHAMHPR